MNSINRPTLMQGKDDEQNLGLADQLSPFLVVKLQTIKLHNAEGFVWISQAFEANTLVERSKALESYRERFINYETYLQPYAKGQRMDTISLDCVVYASTCRVERNILSQQPSNESIFVSKS